jgi:cytosine/adenosine deaminase-related metal-dependent hydrolase
MITRTLDRQRWEEIPGGAVLQEDGIIVEVGAYDDLSRRFPDLAVLGSGKEIMLPGFVNGHHHVGLTPVQLGAPDLPLEQWFLPRMVARQVDPYLDTLYSAFEMIASGVTTVQHVNGWIPGTFAEVKAKCDAVLQAYTDIGMRVSFCYMVRDQNNLSYQSNDAFIASLPEELRAPMMASMARTKLLLEGSMDLFKTLFADYRSRRRIKIQLAPANLHWCSDKALETLAQASRDYDVPLHMHLVETPYQKEYARRRAGGGTAFEYLERFGLPGPNLTLGHGVWLNARDIDRVAETGTCVCHNCSSNFRLRSGIAPLNQFEAKGINTAIGIDEAGINDDRDMLQEMRMVLRAHRTPGHNAEDVPTMAQVLRMATVGGARTTPYGDTIGTIEPGRAADLSLIDWGEIAYPYLDEETPLLDAVIQRAKTTAVRLVMCDGDVIYANGVFTRVDKDAALKALHDQLAHALSPDDVERRKLGRALMPHIKKFYQNYLPAAGNEPVYRQNERH